MKQIITVAALLCLIIIQVQAQTANNKTYQNYDFIPGEKILFEDHFTDDQDGEFPAHWGLESGQGVINKVLGAPAIVLTQGNYSKVFPRMKAKTYLTDPFTIECDYYIASTGGGDLFIFFDAGGKIFYVQYSAHGGVSSH